MIINKSRYIKNTFYYTTLPILKTLLSFMTLPILTRYLVPADYGKLTLISVVVSFFFNVFTLSISESSYRYYFKYKDDIVALRAMLSSNMIFIMFALLASMFSLMVSFSYVNDFFFKGHLSAFWVLMALFQLCLLQINVSNQYIFQNRHEGRTWFKNEIVAIVIQVPLSIILVVTKCFTFEAIILAGLIAELIRCTVLFARLRSYYALTFKWVYFKESVRYAWPMLPNFLISFAYTSFDKTMLNNYKGVSQVGILDMSNRIILGLKMLMDGVGSTLSPVTMDLLTENTKESLKILENLNLKIISFIAVVTLIIILFTQEFVQILTTKEFYYVMYVVPIYIYYHTFGVIGLISYWLIRYPGKTIWSIPINVAILCISIGANILLIPRYGIIGVAISAFVAVGIGNCLQLIIGMRFTPVPIGISRISVVLFTLLVETGLVYLLYYLKPNFFINLMIKLLLLGLFLGVCISLKAILVSDIRSLFAYLKGFLKRMEA